MSITLQQIGITLAAGAGNGVTSNKQVSSTRINCLSIVFDINPNQVELGGKCDLSKFWVQGDTAGDVVEVGYTFRIDG